MKITLTVDGGPEETCYSIAEVMALLKTVERHRMSWEEFDAIRHPGTPGTDDDAHDALVAANVSLLTNDALLQLLDNTAGCGCCGHYDLNQATIAEIGSRLGKEI